VEERLNAYPQFLTESTDSLCFFTFARPRPIAPRGSSPRVARNRSFEYVDLIDRLVAPTAHGADPLTHSNGVGSLRFPTLLRSGAATGVGDTAIAAALAELMALLGYERTDDRQRRLLDDLP